MSQSRIEKVDCIVLKRFPVGENDLIYSVYSAEYGRFRASARGALRVKNKWRGVLEPFHRVEADVAISSRGTLHRFTQAEVLNRPKMFLENLTALHSAYVVLECLERFTPDEVPAREIYELALQAFGKIDAEPKHAGLFVRLFCMEFLLLSGFGFELDQCIRCGKQRSPERSAYCLPAEGGIICNGCMNPDLRTSEKILHRKTIAMVKRGLAIVTDDEADLEIFNQEIGSVINGMFSYHLGDIPKSLSLII